MRRSFMAWDRCSGGRADLLKRLKQKPPGFFLGESREGYTGNADLHRFAQFGRLDDPEHYRQCVQREATRAPVRPFLDYSICHFRETKRTVVRYDRIPEGIIDPSECLSACFVDEPLYLCSRARNICELTVQLPEGECRSRRQFRYR